MDIIPPTVLKSESSFKTLNICAVEKSLSEPDKGISLLSREENNPLPDVYESMR